MNQGFCRAIVCENKDPKNLGRVRVRYHWFHGDSSERPSEWVEVCRPYASATAGFWMIPEVGDEVLVFVENGDVDHPILFGSIYTETNKPPSSGREGDLNSNEKNDLKFLSSRSGHVLCFDDSDSKRAIVLRDKEQRRLEISASEKKITLSDDESTQVVITPGTVTISNKNGDQVVVESGSITIKSQSVKIDAASSIELGAGAAEALVKGQAFMTLFNAHTHTSGGSGSPTSPPVTPMTPAQLSMKVKTV